MAAADYRIATETTLALVKEKVDSLAKDATLGTTNSKLDVLAKDSTLGTTNSKLDVLAKDSTLGTTNTQLEAIKNAILALPGAASAAAAAALDAAEEATTVIASLGGDKLAIDTIAKERGYVLTEYQKKAWNYNAGTIVDSDSVAMSGFIPYTPGTSLTIVVPTGKSARITFTKNGSKVNNTDWQVSTITLQNTNDVNGFTVEYKNSNSSEIDDLYAFLQGTGIYIDSQNKKYVPGETFDQQLGGVFEQLNAETIKSGYVSARFDFYAWDYTNSKKVAVNNVILSDTIPYTISGILFFTVPSGVYFRVTFMSGTSILAHTDWKTTSDAISNSLTGVDGFTVEYKYSDSRIITSIAEILTGTSIYKFSDADKYFYGAYDLTNSNWVLMNTVLHTSISYTNGDYVQIINHYPSVFKFRLIFFNGNTNKGNTNWLTDSFRGSNTNGATSLSIEIKYADDRIITDRDAIIKQFEINPKPEDYIIDDITTVGIFETWATIGDSFSVGRWYENEGGTLVPVRTSRLAWGSIVSREVGNTFLSLGIGGINTRTWLTADPSTGGGLALALSSPKQDLYFLCLGINDTSLGSSYIGTVADIHDSDYTQNADTFYGNYGKIIQQMMNYAPNALFIISKLVAWNDASVKDAYNNAIEGIAEHYGIPCIEPFDDAFFSSNFYQNTRGENNGHPTGMTYGGMAMAYKRLISKCIEQNPNYFKYYNGVADGGD